MNLRRIVAEGEATAVAWTMNAKMKQMMAAFKSTWRNSRDDLSQFDSSPNGAARTERVAFDYTLAADFIDLLATKQGWDAVTKLYKDKPILSTEQVMHPENQIIPVPEYS